MSDSEFEGVISDSDNYEDKINQIETPHGRTKQRTDTLNGEEQSNSRSELWKLIRVSRIERPGAIYEASGSTQ